jgi:hypothetical protein
MTARSRKPPVKAGEEPGNAPKSPGTGAIGSSTGAARWRLERVHLRVAGRKQIVEPLPVER